MSLFTGAMICIMATIALVVVFVWACGKAFRKLLSSQNEASNGEEARLLQELNTKLNRLEHRIESLETIVTSAEQNPRS